MIRARGSRVAAAIAAAVLGGTLILLPTAASAGVVTSVAFETSSPVSVGFGDDWSIVLSVSSSYEGGPTMRLGPNDGSVDVYLSGIGGAYAAALPIQPDGLVYFSQPSSSPLLGAGEYQVTAIYNPAPGGYYDSSQTATPLVLTVTSLAVTPKVEIVNDGAVSERPVITASLGGAYVDATGGAPAGTWHFVVTGSEGEPVFDTDVAQAQGSTEPLRIEMDSKLEKGATYTVVSTFMPVDELAGGLEVGKVPDSTFQTPSGTFGEAVTALIPVPLWLAIALAVILLGLTVAAIIIGARLAGSKVSDDAPATVAPQRLPGEPINVEFVSLDEVGLPEPETIPELLPEGETKKLPVSTTWLLSDIEPATSLPDASEAPTERIDAVTAAELPTELIETDEDEKP